MTLHDVRMIFDHWKRSPPLRALMRGLAKAQGVEFTPQADKAKRYLNADDFDRLIAQTGGTFPGVPRR